MYNTATTTYTSLGFGSSGGPGKIKNPTCTLELDQYQNQLFYVMFGTAVAEQPMGQVHYYNVTSGLWAFVYQSVRPRAAALLTKVDQTVIVLGGHRWGLYLHREFFSIDLEAKTETLLGLSEYFANGAHALLGAFLFLHSGSNNMNSFFVPTIPKNSFFRINLLSLCTGDECAYSCSPGSQLTGSQCALCQSGSFSGEFGTSCAACGKGTYLSEKGGSSSKQCLPCEDGTFNPYTGTSYCLDCPAFSSCPIGSTSYSYKDTQNEDTSVQPKLYEERSAAVSTYSTYIYLGVGCTLLLILIVLLSNVNIRSKISLLDLYNKNHTHIDGKAITLQKNSVGGISTLVFIAAAVILIATAVMQFRVNNLQESKALVPIITLNDEVEHVICM